MKQPTWEDWQASGAAAVARRRLYLVRTRGIIDGFKTAWNVTAFATKRAADLYLAECYEGEPIGWYSSDDRGEAR